MSTSDKADLDAAAQHQANQAVYAWQLDAINIYVVSDLIGAGGICSFPAGAGGNDVIVINNQRRYFQRWRRLASRGRALLESVSHLLHGVRL